MSDYTSPATKLDAVNLILRAYGETRVNSLTGELPFDAAAAEETLDEMVREVQQRGWIWNTEYFKLTPDVNGHVKLPNNTLSADLVDANEGVPVTVRSGRLYNLTPYASGDTWTDYTALEVRLVLGLSFEDLPPNARAYCYHKAARVFVARQEGDELSLNTAGNAETTALTDMKREDNRARPRNLRDSASYRRIVGRGVDWYHNDYGARQYLRRKT